MEEPMSKRAEAKTDVVDRDVVPDAGTVDGVVEEAILPAEVAEQADPNPGEAGYDWSKHYDTDKLYTHTFPNGIVVAIKTFEAIYTKTWLYSIRGLQTNIDFEFAAIDRAACPTAKEVLQALAEETNDDTDPIEDLFKAWTSKGTSRGEGDEGLTPGK